MTEKNKEQNEVQGQDIDVVPLNIIIGELEVIKQKLYQHALTLSTNKGEHDTADEVVPDAD